MPTKNYIYTLLIFLLSTNLVKATNVDTSYHDSALIIDTIPAAEDTIPAEEYQFDYLMDNIFSVLDTIDYFDDIQYGLPDYVPEVSFLTRYFNYIDASLVINDGTINGTDTLLSEFTEAQDSLLELRLNSLNTIFHLKYNEKVRRLIEVYINERKQQMAKMFALSTYYFPIYEQELKASGMPEELKYLSIIESGLNPRAGSNKGAYGLWQFIYRTGMMYGLEVNDEIDERMDPVKSTAAAALYLKSLYAQYKDWTLAIAAYNCGPGRVNRAIRQAKGKRNYWDIYNYLPRETRNYVPAFIGATYAFQYYCEHPLYSNIREVEYDYPEPVDTAVVTQYLSFECIEQITNIPLQTIKDYNPQYLKDVIPQRTEKSYSLTLPASLMNRYKFYRDTILAYSLIEKSIQDSLNKLQIASAPKQQNKVVYKIKRGDNLSFIARRFSVTVDSLKYWNKLKNDRIKANDKLIIYTYKDNVRDMKSVYELKQQIAQEAAERLAAQQTSQQSAQQNKPTQTSPVSSIAQNNTSRQSTNRQQPTKPSAQKPAQSTTQRTSQPTAALAQNQSSTRPVVSTVNKSTPTKQNTKPATTTNNSTKTQPKATSQPVKPKPTTNNKRNLLAYNDPYQRVVTKQETKKSEPLKQTNNTVRSSNITIIQSKNSNKNATSVVHYRVKKGETLFSIYKKHPGSKIQEIISMNNLRSNGNKIYPDQVLKIQIAK